MTGSGHFLPSSFELGRLLLGHVSSRLTSSCVLGQGHISFCFSAGVQGLFLRPWHLSVSCGDRAPLVSSSPGLHPLSPTDAQDSPSPAGVLSSLRQKDLAGHRPKELRLDAKMHAHATSTAATFTLYKRWTRPKCPSVDGWRSETWSMQTVQHH